MFQHRASEFRLASLHRNTENFYVKLYPRNSSKHDTTLYENCKSDTAVSEAKICSLSPNKEEGRERGRKEERRRGRERKEGKQGKRERGRKGEREGAEALRMSSATSGTAPFTAVIIFLPTEVQIICKAFCFTRYTGRKPERHVNEMRISYVSLNSFSDDDFWRQNPAFQRTGPDV